MLYTRGLEGDIPADSNILEWTVEHAGYTWSRYTVGKDATTVYEKWKGRECKRPTCESGERVPFMLVKGARAAKLYWRFQYGTFLGVIAASGAKPASTMSWGLLGVQWATTVSSQLQPGSTDPARRCRYKCLHCQITSRRSEGRRSGRWTFHGYGFAERCPGCSAIHTRLDKSRDHREKCRRRIEEAVRARPEGGERVARAGRRAEDAKDSAGRKRRRGMRDHAASPATAAAVTAAAVWIRQHNPAQSHGSAEVRGSSSPHVVADGMTDEEPPSHEAKRARLLSFKKNRQLETPRKKIAALDNLASSAEA